MNLGVLLLYCKDTGRATRFTREWADRAIQRVADYVLAQSGGRETISFKVFDWIELPLTAAQWSMLGFGAYKSVRPIVQQKLPEGESLDPYTHILIGIDHPGSTGRTTWRANDGVKDIGITHLAANEFAPSNVAHELGHSYGAGDAFRGTADSLFVDGSNDRYRDAFCVMGYMPWTASFFDDVLANPSAPMLNRNGPGMSAPTLLATGWLNEDEHGVGRDLTGSNLSSSGGISETLSALAGAPGPGWMPSPLVVRYHDLLVEYRVGVPDGWDRGLPNPGVGAGGWVVVHRQLFSSILDPNRPRKPSTIYVDSVAAKPGAVLVLGKDDLLDIFNPGPLKIAVLSFDAAARTVNLQFSRRAARPALSGTIIGGVDVGGGGVVWTPGGGFTPVPPHSPLLNVLEDVARVHALQEILALVSDEEVSGLSEEASRALRTLQQSVAELRVEPSVSPLARALESISKLHRTSESLDSSADDREMTREFVDASRQQLAEVERILANAVEEDRQR